MTILQKIQSLLTAANTKTGESDATLTDAVQTLVDGYGQGGGGSGETLLASGTYTFAGGRSLDIPVSFSGTATRVCVIGRDPATGTAQTNAWLNGNLTLSDSAPFDIFSSHKTVCRRMGTSGNTGWVCTVNNCTLANSTITCNGISGSYYPAALTYDWYIWGYTT